MNYEQKYKEGLAWVESIYPELNHEHQMEAEAFFSELAKSEDERIRKSIIAVINNYVDNSNTFKTKILAWLEKQGEQKPILDFKAKDWYVSKVDGKIHNIYHSVDKVEPKFHRGDWIIFNGLILHIDEVVDGYYRTTSIGGIHNSYDWDIDNVARFWTIQDAKDGDVLASNHSIFIFSQEYIAGKPEAHCGIMNGLLIVKPEGCWTNEKCYPATKEQQDILYQKMNEEGYEWLADKKELKMIEQKPAESRQKTKPNGGIVYEDFNEGDGYYKVNLAYLSKSQVELIENLVASWQNPTNNTVEWSEEDEAKRNALIGLVEEIKNQPLRRLEDWDGYISWLKSLRSQNRWKVVDKGIYVKEPALAQKKDKSEPGQGFVVCYDHTLTPDVYERYIMLSDINCHSGWKPSKEQMRALHDMNLTGNISYAGQGQILIELYNDLKKL